MILLNRSIAAAQKGAAGSRHFAAASFTRSFLPRSLAAAALMALVPWAEAVRTEFVIHESFQDFTAGDLENLSLHREGRLRLAPGAEEIARMTDAVIWSAVAAGDGTFYIGAGSEGRVYRLHGDGRLEPVFSAGQALVRALAVDSEGRLYVGSSPHGKVFRYTGEGKAEELFDPGEAYIWSLLFNEAGDLFVGTGDKGKIYRLPAGFEPGDEGELYFDSDESHISTLSWDHQARLLAGTSPRGYLYRIESREEAFVLFNSPDEEIRQVLAHGDGNLYVATFSGTAPTPPRGGATAARASNTVAQALAALASEEREDGQEEQAQPPTPAAAPRRAAPTGPRPSTIYRVDAEGFHEAFWGLPGTAIHALLAFDGGPILIGTGSEGRLFSLAGFQEWTLRQSLPSGSDLSVMLPGAGDGEVLIFTSNPARVYRLDTAISGEGEYLSDIFDASQVARWGRLHVETGPGGSAGVRPFVRTGNTERPDSSWTGWREAGEAGEGAVAGRYFQYRLAFERAEAEVRRVRFFYRHGNAAPVISALRVLTADVGLERYLLPPQPPTLDLDQLLRNPRAQPGPGQEARQQLRVYERPGTITIAWQARDPNDDELVYTLRMRRTDAEEWSTIADEVRESFYSFNGNGLPDGDYQVKVVASDHLSNARGEGRTARRVSEVFIIDNTAPEIVVETVETEGRRARIVFSAADASSMIAAADYIVDGGDPVRLFPEDGIFDSRRERFVVEAEGLSPGPHALFLRVADEARNPRIHQVRVEIQP
jgi:hypothetical protein